MMKYFIQRFTNLVDFNQTVFEFVVKIKVINSEAIKFSKSILIKLVVFIFHYLPISDVIIKSFSLINPLQRKMDNSQGMFRDNLLKNYMQGFS